MDDLHEGADYVRVEIRVGASTKVVELTAAHGTKIEFALGTSHDVEANSPSRAVTTGAGTIKLCAHGPKLSGGTKPAKRWHRLT